ncbi:MAG TPA: inositol monophosphatase family protein [Devosia sp.]|nr:inositol monophosphatase family protein [Devosia sp.]
MADLDAARRYCGPEASPRLLTLAALSLRGGAIARTKLRHFGLGDMVLKGPRDYQTEVDREVETLIVSGIAAAFPDYAIEGEEKMGDRQAGPDAPIVHIDPIDGTTNFAWGIPHFGIVISIEEQDEITVGVVYDPMLDELFSAERGGGAWLNGRRLRVVPVPSPEASVVGASLPTPGQVKSVPLETYHRALRRLMDTTSGVRRFGSAALSFAYVAAGRINGFFEDGLSKHDYGASVLLIREAGGIVTDFLGGPVVEKRGILGAAPDLHAWLVEGFRE